MKATNLPPIVWAIISLAVASIALFLTALLIPPQGEVHPSVLKGLGIMTANIALVNFAYAIATNKVATFKHGKTSATVGTVKKAKTKQNAKDN